MLRISMLLGKLGNTVKIKNILLLIIFVSLFGVLFGANSPRCIYQAKQINQKHHVETTIKKFDLIDKILKTSRNPVSKINKRDWHNEKFRYATRSHKLLGYIFIYYNAFAHNHILALLNV